MSGRRKRERHGVVGVGVLRATVEQYEFGLSVAPAQSAQLTKSVDGDEEALAPFGTATSRSHSSMFSWKIREFVVRELRHESES